MTGFLFARTLKHDRAIRADFEAWVKEQRDYAVQTMIAGAGIEHFTLYQGKIRQLDQLLTTLEELTNQSES